MRLRAGTLLLGGLLAAVLASGTASPARAQTPGPAGGTGSPDGSLMEQVIPATPCPAATGVRAGRFPVSAYRIDYDEGGFTAVSRKIVGTLTEMTFAGVRWLVSVGTWLVGWSFSFAFANRLAAPVARVANRYRVAFFVPLIGSALLISAAYGALQIFRGRMARGLGEIALSLLLVGAFATWLLANPGAFLDSSLRVTAQLAGSVAMVALPDSPAGCAAEPGSYALPRLDAAVAPLAQTIQQSFVERPYELLQWGSDVPPGCRPARDTVLAAGPGGDRDQLVAAMDRPGCAGMYRFNRDPSTERLGVALAVLVAAAILMVSLGLVAGSVVAAQVVAVALIAIMPFAALAAALPGSGRAAAWSWAGALVRALATIVVMSSFLTFLLLAADALLQSAEGQSLLVQMAVLNVVAVLGISLRRRMVHSMRRTAAGVTRRLQRTEPAAAWSGPVAGRGPRSPGESAALGAGSDVLAGRVAEAVTRTRAAAGVTSWIGSTP
jgi:hypothetical protein